MPSRNVLKYDVEGGYYHVYARGVSRMPIFKEPTDYAVFLNLYKRCLSKQPVYDQKNISYPHLYGDLELLCYCLMTNHFHLLIYQTKQGSMTQLMRSVMTSYSRYFNKKNGRSGPLFESRYKASLIGNQSYLEHISRYIHLNPKDWRTYAYSSLPYSAGMLNAEWILPSRIMDIFDGPEDYVKFLADYESHKEMLEEIKYELADTTTHF